VNYLNGPEKERLKELIRLRRKLKPIWSPFPDSPQQMAYQSDADIIFYGGAAGGGKSDFLCGLAVTKHTRSIIYRRESTAAKQIIGRIKQLIGRDGYNGTDKRWDLPDKEIQIGSVPHPGTPQEEGDEAKYQGNPYDLIGFDEVTQFPEYIFKYLQTWNRTDKPGQKCRVVATFNPPRSAEAQWVLSYLEPWLDIQSAHKAEPGELRHFVINGKGERVWVDSAGTYEIDGEERISRSVTFIPAKATDNPVYMKTGYLATLDSLPEPLRSQMRDGDMQVGLVDDLWQAIPSAWVKAAMDRYKKNTRTEPHSGTAIDPSQGGRDNEAIAMAYGHRYEIHDQPGTETPSGKHTLGFLNRVYAENEGNPKAEIGIDAIGYGADAYGRIKDFFPSVVAMKSQGKAKGKDESGRFSFASGRAKMWWRLREDLNPNSGLEIELPDDPEVLADLTAPLYEVTASGIKVEEKKYLIKRIGRSPGKGDALVYLNEVRRTQSNANFAGFGVF